MVAKESASIIKNAFAETNKFLNDKRRDLWFILNDYRTKLILTGISFSH